MFLDDTDEPLSEFYLSKENTALLVIDIQERLVPAMAGGEDVVKQAEEDGVVNPIYEYPEWSDITDDVYGGVLPEGLEHSEGAIVETASAEYEQHYFILEEEEEEQAAVFANTWVDGVAMPEVPNS